ncbi:MAG: hypothetical protein KC468_37720 [Myxococcales bacterium]|nr:hypothetical protein [Myxococcales bacterium]
MDTQPYAHAHDDEARDAKRGQRRAGEHEAPRSRAQAGRLCSAFRLYLPDVRDQPPPPRLGVGSRLLVEQIQRTQVAIERVPGLVEVRELTVFEKREFPDVDHHEQRPGAHGRVAASAREARQALVE